MFLFFKCSLHLFKPTTVFGLEYSVLTRSILCLINKSLQFCNTGNKYEVAITCAFGRRLRKSFACNLAQVYGLKVFNLVFGRKM